VIHRRFVPHILGVFLLFGVDFGILAASLDAAPACTVTVPPSTSNLDGRTLHPGAVVCLPAGSRGSLTITSANGTADAPITVTNAGGVVAIQGDDYAGIWLQGSSYVRVLGSGVAEHCGAQFAESDQQCGLVLVGTATGRGVSATKKSTHIEVAYVEVSGAGNAAINIKDDSQRNTGWVLDGVYVHHTWVHDVGNEAMYLGSSYYVLGDAPTRNIEVASNRTRNIGWESYQVSGADTNCRIHDNIAAQDSQIMESGQVGSIKVKEGSVCDITDNQMVDGGSRGITDYGHGGNTIARNTVIRAGRLESLGANSGSGIVILDGDVSGRTLHIDGNTIDSPRGNGISVSTTLSSASTIQDNRICAPGGVAVKGGAAATINNNGCSTPTPTPTVSPTPTPSASPTAIATSTPTAAPTDTLVPVATPTLNPCGV
jgi:hypothetical protein